ncbi:hypothetical protein EYF80_039000 [Liparis tanakae]|uniref:Uncharacterized protein n=1 Tax=Liparis tanakae TaxID=230148 RepID=A0A4Z2GB20_9TELE|nr:hypothetical protein EYF80_039000 [Liparis tanakae]
MLQSGGSESCREPVDSIRRVSQRHGNRDTSSPGCFHVSTEDLMGEQRRGDLRQQLHVTDAFDLMIRAARCLLTAHGPVDDESGGEEEEPEFLWASPLPSGRTAWERAPTHITETPNTHLYTTTVAMSGGRVLGEQFTPLPGKALDEDTRRTGDGLDEVRRGNADEVVYSDSGVEDSSNPPRSGWSTGEVRVTGSPEEEEEEEGLLFREPRHLTDPPLHREPRHQNHQVVYPWTTRGLRVVYVWSTCGLPVVYLWPTRGLPVAYLWSTCGLPVAYLWPTCGLPVAYLWSTCGLPVAYPWSTCGLPVVLKLKSMGRSLPLGSLVLGWRSSSKKACEQASRGEKREAGVYSSSREHRAMASGGVRGLNT